VQISFVDSWMPFAFRGFLALLFATIAFLWPSVTLAGLVLVFGAYALTDGVLAIAAAIRLRGGSYTWALMVEGLAGVGTGLFAFLWTGATALFLVRVIALWAVLTGMLELALALRLRREMPGELMFGFAGTISVLVGILMFLWPEASAFVLVILLGCYALFFGVAMLAFALGMRRAAHVPGTSAVSRSQTAR